MEKGSRTLAKALSWQLLGLFTMSGLGWLVTGSLGTGGSLAALSAVTGLCTYVVHERIWDSIGWGRDAWAGGRPTPPPPAF